MILLAHMLFGAAIGSLATNPFIAVVLAFLSHYFLDLFPHIEYLTSTENSIRKLKTKHLEQYLPDVAKTLIDFCLGLVMVAIFSPHPLSYLCALVAVIPDGLTIVTLLFPSPILEKHHIIHTQKIHYLTKKKHFPIFIRIMTQVIALLVSVMIL